MRKGMWGQRGRVRRGKDPIQRPLLRGKIIRKGWLGSRADNMERGNRLSLRGFEKKGSLPRFDGLKDGESFVTSFLISF